MARFICILSLYAGFVVTSFAQTPVSPSTPSSDAQALAIATKSVGAMTGGISVSDATLNATVTRIVGSDYDTGTAKFSAKGINNSRIDLNLSDETRSESRSTDSAGIQSGQWKKGDNKANSVPQHNCWTDAAWFFPALTSITQVSNPNYVFSYVGPEQHNGLSSLHLRITHTVPGDTTKMNLSRYTAIDFYLDPTTYLPSAMAFAQHLDADLGTDVPSEIRFANYQLVQGVQVPFRIQRLLNGSLLMDATITGVNVNTGLANTQFTLQ